MRSASALIAAMRPARASWGDAVPQHGLGRLHGAPVGLPVGVLGRLQPGHAAQFREAGIRPIQDRAPGRCCQRPGAVVVPQPQATVRELNAQLSGGNGLSVRLPQAADMYAEGTARAQPDVEVPGSRD